VEVSTKQLDLSAGAQDSQGQQPAGGHPEAAVLSRQAGDSGKDASWICLSGKKPMV
jgi:hypothetical protein